MPQIEDWLWIPEAAELAGVSRQRMHQIVAAGGVTTIRVNKRTLISRESVLKRGREKQRGGSGLSASR